MANLNAKSERVFNCLMQALLQFLKGLYYLGLIRDDTAVIVGDDDLSFVVHTELYDDDDEDEDDEDETLH